MQSGKSVTRTYNGNPDCQTDLQIWLRSLGYPFDSRKYDIENLDYIVFLYRQNWFFTMEEKCHGAQSSPAQQDTHGIVTQLLAIASGSVINTMRGRRRIYYRGHYVVSFENTYPPNSAWVRINETLYNDPTRAVIELLKIGHLPELKG